MTREEAIAILEVSKHMATSGRLYNQAIDMAIEALQREEKEKTMKNDKQFEDALKRIGKVAEVGEDWYEIGEAEKGEDGETRYGIYAKTDEIAEKVGKVFDRIIADKSGDEE